MPRPGFRACGLGQTVCSPQDIGRCVKRSENPRLTPSLSFSENLRSGVDAKPMDLANDERLKRLTDQIEHGKDPHRVLELAQELLRLLDGGPEDRLLDKSSC